MGYARLQEDWPVEKEAYQVLYPQMGAALVGPAGPFVPVVGPFIGIGGAVAGHAAGRTAAASMNQTRNRRPPRKKLLADVLQVMLHVAGCTTSSRAWPWCITAPPTRSSRLLTSLCPGALGSPSKITAVDDRPLVILVAALDGQGPFILAADDADAAVDPGVAGLAITFGSQEKRDLLQVGQPVSPLLLAATRSRKRSERRSGARGPARRCAPLRRSLRSRLRVAAIATQKTKVQGRMVSSPPPSLSRRAHDWRT